MVAELIYNEVKWPAVSQSYTPKQLKNKAKSAKKMNFLASRLTTQFLPKIDMTHVKNEHYDSEVSWSKILIFHVVTRLVDTRS